MAPPNDFSRMPSRASHPELIDWLAADLIENGVSTSKSIRKQFIHSYLQNNLQNIN